MGSDTGPGKTKRAFQLRLGIVVPLALLVLALEVFFLDGWFLAVVVSGTLAVATLFPSRFGGHRQWSLAAVAVLMLAATLGSIRWNASRAQEQGQAIARACENFKAQSGQYPETLEQLVPKYLAAIPPGKVTYGSRWRYGFDPKSGLPPGLMLVMERSILVGFEVFDFDTRELRLPPR